MGYDRLGHRSYGPSLMDLPSQDRKFMIGGPDFHPTIIPADHKIGVGIELK